MNEESAFIAALAAEPSDRAAALVFADWLEERGDPRGPMLRIDEVRAWMAPTYADPLPDLAAALESGKKVTQASKLLALIGEAAVPTLLALLRHGTPIVRLRAVKALRLMGARAKPAIPVLTELVKESDPENADVRQEAVRVLGALRVKGAVKDELAKGLDSSDAAERLAAVQAMSKLRTKTAAGSLCKALADSSGDVRRAAAQQLRYIAGPTTPFAVEPLRQALADADAVVRTMAVVALGKIGPEAAAAVPDFLRLLKDTAGKARAELVEALGAIGVGIPEVLEAVLGGLRGADGTREAARVALTKWPAIPALAAPALLELVRNPNSGSAYWDGQLVRAGLRALARIVPPPPEVLAELRAQLAGKNAIVVAGALGEIGPRAAPLLPELTAAFYQNEKNGNAYAIAKAIGQIGGEGIVALAQALGRAPAKDDVLPAAAAGGLKEAGPAALAALPALLARLRRKDVTFGRAFVVDALAALGPDAAAAVPDLVALLVGDHEPHETSSLAGALRAFGPALLPFAPQLTEALRQPARARTHVRTVELLAGLIPHGFEAFPVLHDVLRRAVAGDFYAAAGHRSDYLRREIAGAAVAGLAALGPAAEPALPDLVLADQTFASSDVRQKVLAAYGAIGGAAVPHIRASLTNPGRDIRVAAIKALSATGDTSPESEKALRRAEMDSVRLVRAQATSALRSLATRKAKRK